MFVWLWVLLLFVWVLFCVALVASFLWVDVAHVNVVLFVWLCVSLMCSFGWSRLCFSCAISAHSVLSSIYCWWFNYFVARCCVWCGGVCLCAG